MRDLDRAREQLARGLVALTKQIKQVPRLHMAPARGRIAVSTGVGAEPPISGVIVAGDKGDRVRAIQALLKARGWNVTVDGRYGPQTTAAIRAFQRHKGLTVTGNIGSETWKALWSKKVIW